MAQVLWTHLYKDIRIYDVLQLTFQTLLLLYRSDFYSTIIRCREVATKTRAHSYKGKRNWTEFQLRVRWKIDSNIPCCSFDYLDAQNAPIEKPH